jgi:chromosome segregation ATPase
MKLQQLQQDFAQVKLAHANELVTIMENEEEKRVQLEKAMKDEFNQRVRDFEEQLEKNYIARDIYNKLVQQIDEVTEKMDELTTQLTASKDSIVKMKQEIVERDNEKEILRRNLDNTTLQLSKLGVQYNRELVKRTQEVENLLKSTGEEKLQLNSKIAKMESTNALLQKELLSKTTRTADNSVVLTKHKQQQTVTSDYSQSGGYTSEDYVCQNSAAKLRFNNSSPDLGIESSENVKLERSLDKNSEFFC